MSTLYYHHPRRGGKATKRGKGQTMTENEEAQYMIDVRSAAEYLLARGVPQNEIIPYIAQAAEDALGRITASIAEQEPTHSNIREKMMDKEIELTEDDLRREIAERIGWRMEPIGEFEGKEHFALLRPDGTRHVYNGCEVLVTDSAHAFPALPNWPEDSGAALELCMEIADRIVQELSIGVEAGRYYAMYDNIVVNDQQTLALALSRLALLALLSE